MKILLTGANGQLGRCFQDRLPQNWQVWATDSAELDITNKDEVLAATKKYQPDVIVNAAAYTAVDKAESEPEIAAQVNTLGPMNLALGAKAVNARLVHVSTDYVFDGMSTYPYVESDATNPLGVYGKTKLDGELAVAETLPESIIIRTAWVFSEYGNNFVKTMIRLAKDRDELKIVADQCGCPTYAGDIASAIINLIHIKAVGGIYHYCGDLETSWDLFAQKIIDCAFDSKIISSKPIIKAISTSEYPTPAKRPKYSSLCADKINALNIPSSNWNDALHEIIPKI